MQKPKQFYEIQRKRDGRTDLPTYGETQWIKETAVSKDVLYVQEVVTYFIE